jgi:branched-chain amino acid transport system permease protein
VTSAIYAMLALGFTVVFGVARTLNLAHGAFYAVGAYLAYLFSVEVGLPLLVAALASVLLTAGFGALTEIFVIRPQRASQLAVLVVTLGLGLVVEQVLLLAFGSEVRNVPAFIEAKYTIGGADVAGQRLLTLGACATVLAALWALVHHTRVGGARGRGRHPGRTVPVREPEHGTPRDGEGLRDRHRRRARVAAGEHPRRRPPGLLRDDCRVRDLVRLDRGRVARGGARDAARPPRRAARQARGVLAMTSLHDHAGVSLDPADRGPVERRQTHGPGAPPRARHGALSRLQWAVLAILALLFLALPPLAASGYLTGVLTVALVYAIWAMSLDAFSGLSGRENLGHSLFIGAGGYATAWATVSYGLSPWLGLVAGVLAPLGLALLIGVPTLRLRGPYFTLAMLSAAAIAQRLCLIFWDRTGGEEGIQGLPPLVADGLQYYYVVLAAAVLSGAALVGMARSRWGILLRAIRGDEAACQAAGIDVTFYKMAGLLVSAGFAGLGGALYAHYQLAVGPSLFSILLVLTILTMMYVGGVSSVYGAAGGGVVLAVLGELLRGFGAYRLLVYGVILLVVVFFKPRGIIAPFWRFLGTRGARGRSGP